MPTFRTFWGLLAFVSGLGITFLGVAYVGQLGVVAMIFKEAAFTYVYPVISTGIQILSYVAMAAIVYLFFWAVINYAKNRGKPEKPSPELLAINELANSINSLIAEIRRDRDERKK